MTLRLLLSLLLGTAMTGYAQSMKAEEWKKRSIYQVLTDRFAPTSAADEAVSCDPSQRQYCGGTWQGTIRRLDYIQGMGFDAVWISPITKQIEDNTAYGRAFHGYWQEDIYSVNPHFGSSSDLLALSDALHSRGMALMVDVVVNHFGSSSQVDFSRYKPFNDGSYFHSEAFITDYNNQDLVERGWLGNSDVPLPDVNTELPAVVNTFNQWISALVQNYKIDGLRLDTVKHVRKDFWPGFVNSANVFALGEVLSGDPNYLSSYQPYVGGLLDYATYYPILRAFGNGGSMGELANLAAPTYRALFRDTQLLATFMENHDQARFPSSTSRDLTIVQNALAYTLLSDGIPIVYYGQEQSFSGDNDPYNREAMWTSGFGTTTLYKFISLLNQARRLAWDAGFGSNLTTPLYSDQSVLISQKGPLLLVLSNRGTGAVSRTLGFNAQYPSGTILANVLTCSTIVVGKSSSNTTILSGAPQVFLPVGLAKQICPTIVTPTQSTSILTKITSIFSSSSSKAMRPVFYPGTTAKTSTSLAITKTSPAITPTPTPTVTTTTRAGRPPAPITQTPTTAPGRPAPPTTRSSTTNLQQKRDLGVRSQPASPALGSAQSNGQQAPKRQAHRLATAPPASLSQYYREERSTLSIPTSPYGLSSTYSYSSSHLPASGGRMSESSRSNSENNLAATATQVQHKPGHTHQSRSMHSLRKQSSHTSLNQIGRARSFNADTPPMPPVPTKLESRNALMSDNAPYSHTFSLSSTSLSLPQSTPMPRSRRNSNGSVRSVYTTPTVDPTRRRRNASAERQNLLAQEHGPVAFVDKAPSQQQQQQQQQHLHPHQNNNNHHQQQHHHLARHGRERLDGSPSVSPQPRSPNGLPNLRRPDHRAQVQQEVRQFPL